MPHSPLQIEDRINQLAKACVTEDFVLSFGYDPTAEKWFSKLNDADIGNEVVEYVGDDLDEVIAQMENHLEL